jgi:splicing factor 3A subunit 1
LKYKEDKEREQEQKKLQEKQLEDPEESGAGDFFNFSYRMPSISLKQDDVLKLTAQYVAINGEDFLIALTERKRSNPLFSFLKPSNSKFNYFTRMVDSYVKIIGFGRKEYQQIQDGVSDRG